MLELMVRVALLYICITNRSPQVKRSPLISGSKKENEWGTGPILAILLAVSPLYEITDMVQKLREEDRKEGV